MPLRQPNKREPAEYRNLVWYNISMSSNTNHVPQGWISGGSNPSDYELAIDTETFHTKSPSGIVKSTKNDPSGFATLMQEFKAKKYLGKRMRLKAFIKTKNVDDWAGLWMRVDGAGHEVLGFDNMKNRSLKGTNDWKQYEIVLDVPKESKLIAFGVLLSGNGHVWIDDIVFEEVTKAVESTNMEIPLPSSPTNLNFQSN